MKRFRARCLSDPKREIEFEATDHGELVPAYDEGGRLFAAYSSEFHVGGRVIFVQVRKDEADSSGNAAEYRMRQDELALMSLDVDMSHFEVVAQ